MALQDRLVAGQSLVSNSPYNFITSNNFYLVMQQDGNLVLYRGNSFLPQHAAWASNTCGKPHGPFTLTMQHDGNLVVYDSHRHPTWASCTNGKGHGNHTAVVTYSGSLEVLDGHNHKLWHSHITHHVPAPAPVVILPTHQLPGPVHGGHHPHGHHGHHHHHGHHGHHGHHHGGPHHPQPGRHFHHTQCLSNGEVLTSTSTNAISAGNDYYLVMQDDGNLVLYHTTSWLPHNAKWSSQTCNKGHGPFRFTMQADGNAVIYDSINHPTWATNTNRPGHGNYQFQVATNGTMCLKDSHHHQLWHC
eukprot:gene12471-14630_t